MSDPEHTAMGRLRYAAEVSARYYGASLILTYSGGKDSELLLALTLRAGIDFEVRHSLTAVDTPETVYHNDFNQHVMLPPTQESAPSAALRSTR